MRSSRAIAGAWLSALLALAAPGVQALTPYEPGKPIEEVQRELGLESVVKLASNENPEGPLPAVLEAVIETARRGLSFGAPCVLETQIAAKITGLMPSIERLRMVSSGTEATMYAVRLARAQPQRARRWLRRCRRAAWT